MADSWRGMRTKRITTNSVHQLAPDSFPTLALIAIYSTQSQPASAQVNTRTPSKYTRPVQGSSLSFNMQATMSPIPIPMLPHLDGVQTALAAGSTASNLVAPLLRQPSAPSLHAPAPQRLVRHATAPEPRAHTPHPSRNKRKASFHELSPEIAERPSKRPKIEQDISGTVAIHIVVGGSSRNSRIVNIF
jgi:hypothetical protein